MRACSYKYIRYIFWKLFYNSTIGHLREGTGIFFKILKTFYDLLNLLKFILCFSNAIFGLHLSNTIQSFQFRHFKHGRHLSVLSKHSYKIASPLTRFDDLYIFLAYVCPRQRKVRLLLLSLLLVREISKTFTNTTKRFEWYRFVFDVVQHVPEWSAIRQ